MSANGEEVKGLLFTAVRDGDLQKVEQLVNCYGLSYCSNWSSGYIFLCYAVRCGRVEVANFLLQKGVDVNKQNIIKDSLLHSAAVRGNVDMVHMLIDRNAFLDIRNVRNETPLHLATQIGHNEVVRVLLSRGAYCCPMDDSNMEPLLIAVDKGSYEIFNLLLSSRRRCLVFNPQPLHLALFGASAHGRKGMLLALLNANADPNAVIDPCFPASHRFAYYLKRGLSPLLLACEKGYTKSVNALLQHGAQVDPSRLCDNYKPLHIASERGFVEIVGHLLDNGANPNATADNSLTPLHLAAKRGIPKRCLQNSVAKNQFLKLIEMLLNSGANVNAQTDAGSTPLLLALECKHEEVTELLLEQGACVNIKDKDNNSPLYLAMQNRHLSLISCILRYKPDVDERVNKLVLSIAPSDDLHKEIVDNFFEYTFITKQEDVRDFDLLPAAIKKGHVNVVKNLLAIGADPNDERYDSSLLHRAVKNGHVEMIKLLLKSGCDVNSERKSDHLTPISLSFYPDDKSKCLEIIQLLLANGADITQAPNLLLDAIDEGSVEICEFLIKNGADVDGTLYDTPLHRTARCIEDKFVTHLKRGECRKKFEEAKRVEIARLLLSNDVDVNSQDDFDYTTLHLAAMNGWLQLTLLLLKFKADVNAKAIAFCTPLHCAVKAGHTEIAETLLNSRAEVDASLNDGEQTPLHFAAHRGFAEMVKLLLRFDADINARDFCGNTAFHCAMRQNQHEVVTTLLINGCNPTIKNEYGNTAFDLLFSFDFDTLIDDTDYFVMYKDRCDSDEDQESISNCDYQEGHTKGDVINAVLNHINIFKTAGVFISFGKDFKLRNRRVLESRSDRKYMRSDIKLFSEHECKKEVEKLHEVKFCPDLTLFDILMNYTDPTFAKNKSIVHTLKSFDHGEFPIYRNLIENWLEKNLWMKTLSHRGLKWLNIIIKTSSTLHQQYSLYLPIELLHEIVSYLDKKDLCSLIFCGRDLKNQLCQ